MHRPHFAVLPLGDPHTLAAAAAVGNVAVMDQNSALKPGEDIAAVAIQKSPMHVGVVVEIQVVAWHVRLDSPLGRKLGSTCPHLIEHPLQI